MIGRGLRLLGEWIAYPFGGSRASTARTGERALRSTCALRARERCGGPLAGAAVWRRTCVKGVASSPRVSRRVGDRQRRRRVIEDLRTGQASPCLRARPAMPCLDRRSLRSRHHRTRW